MTRGFSLMLPPFPQCTKKERDRKSKRGRGEEEKMVRARGETGRAGESVGLVKPWGKMIHRFNSVLSTGTGRIAG